MIANRFTKIHQALAFALLALLALPLSATNPKGMVLPSPFWSQNSSKIQSAKKLLFIGDSHSVASFGDHLREIIVQESTLQFDLLQYAVSGSHLMHWMNGDFAKLRIRNLTFTKSTGLEKSKDSLSFQLIEKIRMEKPDQLIIALGTNDILALKNGLIKWEDYEKHLDALKSAGVPIVWILPPQLHAKKVSIELQDRYREMLLRFFHGSQSLNSANFLPDQNDGIHFNKALARLWADSIWMQYKQFHLNL